MDKISFWELLKKYKVVIPIIQRDYAQGRKGKEHLREKFLPQIKHALDNSNPSGALDFVYGTTKNKSQNEIIFYPLDGQQRLTTLWLLHWFIASKAGKLEEAKETLKKFSYETRTSSREFCEKLCEFDICNVVKAADAIQKQTWFYAAWKQDPTIQSMLRMIEGTDKKNKNGNDFIDGIEEAFQCYDGECIECHFPEYRYIEYWNKLTGSSCPIKFSKLEIESTELPVPDDLYIKMNARGKPLSDFENFKADLLSSLSNYLSKKDVVAYGSLIDNDWTNYFWNKDEIDIFDSKWMAFLCRVAVCVKIENSKNNTNEGIAAILKDWRVYKDDRQESFVYQYKDFRDFQNIFNANLLGRLENIFPGWQKLSSVQKFSLASAWNDNFDFIPVRKEKSVSTLSMKTRVLFYGTMLFCEKYADETNKEDACLIAKWNAWKRVMWNLAENTNESSTIDGFVGVMKMINQLAKGCLDIYNYLTTTPLNDFKFDQLQEEIDKATQIIETARDCKCNCCGPDYRKIQEAEIQEAESQEAESQEAEIQKAESTAFFHGAIRFLYTDAGGNVNWGEFEQKYKNVKQYFDKNGVCQSYKDNAILLRRFLSHMNSWEQWWQLKYDSTKDNWHDILLNKNLRAPVHELLTENESKQFDFNSYKSPFRNDDKQKFLTEFLIKEQVLKELPAGWKLVWRQSWDGGEGVYDLDPQTRGSHPYFIIHPRIKLLADLADKEIGLVNIERNEYYIPGVDIDFQYNECNFRWLITRNSNEYEVYLLDEENNYAKRCNPQGDSEEDMYYCVNIFKSYSDFEQEEFQKKFKDALKTLIEAYKDEG